MATKEKILDTAERLIASQGFAATSLRQIISEALVSDEVVDIFAAAGLDKPENQVPPADTGHHGGEADGGH